MGKVTLPEIKPLPVFAVKERGELTEYRVRTAKGKKVWADSRIFDKE